MLRDETIKTEKARWRYLLASNGTAPEIVVL
jgi:hypothetical protein